jgi:hypothetical protein
MKKFLIVASFALALITTTVNAQSTTPRFGTAANQDNTGRALNYKLITTAATATYTIAPNAYETVVRPTTITSVTQFNATVTNAKLGDNLTCFFFGTPKGSTVTFNTNFLVSASTIVVDSAQTSVVQFRFNGAKFQETGRHKE